jgi:membrane protease YdiL (CAAX protease family)
LLTGLVCGVPVFLLIIIISLKEKLPLSRSLKTAFWCGLIASAIVPLNVFFSFKHLGVFPGSSMNWGGLLAVTAAALLITCCSRITTFKHIGLSNPVGAKSVGLSLLVGVAIYLVGLTLTSPISVQINHFKQQLAFEMVMPGLAEEIVFRGILLAIINSHFGKSAQVLGIRIGWATFIVSTAFALGHVGVPDHLMKELPQILGIAVYTFTASLMLALLRERTGSLWPCILAHNFTNTLELLISRFFVA